MRNYRSLSKEKQVLCVCAVKGSASPAAFVGGLLKVYADSFAGKLPEDMFAGLFERCVDVLEKNFASGFKRDQKSQRSIIYLPVQRYKGTLREQKKNIFSGIFNDMRK